MLIIRILEAIESIAEDIPVENTSEPVVITRNTFAVSVQQVDLDETTINDRIFSANLGNFSVLDINENIDPNDLSFETSDNQPTASLRLPNNLFSAVLNVTNITRITHSVFLSDNLFLRRENDNKEVGGIIISASVVGSDSINALNPPITIRFLKNPV